MLNDILERLDKVRRHGDRYRAVCPVHDGNNPTALSLKEEDGKVLIHCHVCLAKGPDVVRAIGLTDAALFRDAPVGGKSYFSREQKEVATEDKFFIEIYNNQIANGHQPSREEYRRYRLSQQRVKILESA
jgi:putative DNA primase/helicase